MRRIRRSSVVVILLIVAYYGVVFGLFFFAPTQHGDASHPDAIIVLGTPSNADGTPSIEQRERTMEGVREYQRGVSQHLIFTGGAAHNAWTEAHTMAVLAEANGVPASAVVEEAQAKDTIQNIYYSEQIMQARGWHSAEVISSPYHLPRTALILSHHPQLAWRTHASPWPVGATAWKKVQRDWAEANYGFKLRLFGFKPSKFIQ